MVTGGQLEEVTDEDPTTLKLANQKDRTGLEEVTTPGKTGQMTSYSDVRKKIKKIKKVIIAMVIIVIIITIIVKGGKKIYENLNGNNEKASGKGMMPTTFKEHHASQSYYNDTQRVSTRIKNTRLRKMGIVFFRKNEGVSFRDQKISRA